VNVPGDRPVPASAEPGDRPVPASAEPVDPSAVSAAVSWVREQRAVAELVRRQGIRVVAGKALARGSHRLLSGAQPFGVEVRHDHLLADPVHPPPFRTPDARAGLTINWVTNPPYADSGGITTIMRLIGLLEARGHECRIYILYKGTRTAIELHRRVVRAAFPSVRASVDDLDDGMEPADAIFATAWPTAYVVRSSPTPGARFYLVQDFEPLFYPAGSDAVLAEETYRFAFHGLTAGPWLAAKLGKDYGMPCDSFDLGVDLDCYRFDPESPRSGIVFYARPDTPRRGFELGMLALERFSRRHPEVEIHLIGQKIAWRSPTFPFVNHGSLRPSELAAIYNRCAAGLVLSLTNLSLLPAELLAAGCIPVMNDAEHTRMSCDNAHARFARALPDALADELCAVVEAPVAPAVRAAAAASVGPLSWDLVADQVERGILRGLGLDPQPAS